MKDVSKLKSIIDDLKKIYSFNGVYHFTNFSNLKSILSTGYLYSRYDCSENRCIFKDAASKAVIHKTELEIQKCVRFYYREQSYTLYVNEGIKKEKFITDSHCPIPVYLLFDEKLILDENTYFADGNAKSKYTTINNTSYFFQSMDWQSIFSKGSLYGTDRENRECKRKRQAELLSINAISTIHLKKIYFRTIADKRRAVNLFGSREYFLVDSEKFSTKNFEKCKEEYENNFITDYKYKIIDLNNNRKGLVLKISFNKDNLEDYKLSYDVIDKNGNWKPSKNTEIHQSKLLNGMNDFKKIDLIFGDYCYDWDKINIYLNGILSIELDVSKDNFDIKRNLLKALKVNRTGKGTEDKLIIEFQYNDTNFLDFDHYIEICDSNMKVIDKYEILVSKENLKLNNKTIIINNFNKSARFINYLIDGLTYDVFEIK